MDLFRTKMKAIIFTAGMGKRIRPLTKNIPKGLLKIKNKTILEYQIESLNNLGIKDIVLVIGHGSQKVRELFGQNIKYIFNPNYRIQNNISSQWVAKEEIIRKDCLCMHGDIIFHKKILEDILNHEGDIDLAVKEKDKKDMIRVRVENGLITQITKPIPFDETYGNFIGIAKYSAGITKELIEATERYILEGKTNVFFTEPINELIKKGVKVYPVPIKNLPWFEVDDKKDLQRVRKNIFN